MFEYVSTLPEKYKIIHGDFNLPSIDWKYPIASPTIYLPLINSTVLSDWQQHITEPTRQQNTLDLIFTSGINYLEYAIGPPFPSCDHRIITAKITYPPQKTTQTATTPKYSAIDWNKFVNIVLSTDWSNVFLSKSITEATDAFQSTLHSVITTLLPPSNQRTSKQNIPRNISKKIRRLRKALHVNADLITVIQYNKTILDIQNPQIQNLHNEEKKH